MFTCLERGTETAQRDVPIPGYLRYSAGVQVAAAFTEGGKQSAQSPGRALEKHCHAWQTEFLQRPPHTTPLVARGVEQGSDTGQRNLDTLHPRDISHRRVTAAWGEPLSARRRSGDQRAGARAAQVGSGIPMELWQHLPGPPNPSSQLPTPYLDCFVSSICCGTT